MTIQISDDDYILAMWYSNDPHTRDNWLCFIKRDDDPDGDWKGTTRFRYKKDDKVFDSEDEKSWTDIVGRKDKSKPKLSEDEMIKFIDGLQKALSGKFSDMDKMIVKGDLKKFLELSKEKEWINLKKHTLN